MNNFPGKPNERANGRAAGRPAARRIERRRARQRGAVAVLLAIAMFALIGLLGIVVDLGHVGIRKTELQNAADAAALAGVRQLNGQASGVDAAVAAAIAAAAANASDFGKTAVAIADAQIAFGATPDGPWSASATARANPAGATFVKVDTTGIAQGTRITWFAPLLAVFSPASAPALASTTAAAVAVAGAPICEGVPIFICAQPGGFKPGQTYFFGESPGYPVGPGNIGYFDPVPPGAPSLIGGANDMRNVICAGKTYCLGTGTYSSLTQNAFGTMARAFNTRFDNYQSLPASLTPAICPPDSNVKEYPYTDLKPASKPEGWMSPAPDRQSEMDPGAVLGVHWSAVLPQGAALTGVGAVPSAKYPATGTPYTQPVGSIYNQQPVAANRIYALAKRRIVTMAIASNCGAISGSGKPVAVSGFGRFFMPVQAVGTGGNKGIYVEYIETVSRQIASAPDIKLYR